MIDGVPFYFEILIFKSDFTEFFFAANHSPTFDDFTKGFEFKFQNGLSWYWY